MRCKACNVALSDVESCAKDPDGRFYDLCYQCLGWHLDALGEMVEEGMSFIDPEAQEVPHTELLEGNWTRIDVENEEDV